MRKTMLLMLFLGSLVLFTKPLVAQEKTVTGTVMGEKNLPLRDVTVLVKGTRIATKKRMRTDPFLSGLQKSKH